MNNLTPLACFLHWESQTPNRTFLRQPVNSEWRVYTYREAGDEVRRIASALQKLLPGKSNIAILSKNCAHWILADLAIMMAGHISVPIYPTLSAEGIRPLLLHSETKLIIIGKLDAFESQRPGIPDDVIRICLPLYSSNDGISWDTLLKEHEPLANNALPAESDLATIMYSSGTTGAPKGVMLSHGSFGFVGRNVARHFKVTQKDRFFSYLPLSHIAERALMEMVVLASGCSISFSESIEKFGANLQHEKPTIFGGVPRIYAKFQEGILKKLSPPKLLILMALPIIRTIVSRSIRKKLGLSEARIIASGAAPTPVSLLNWFRKLRIEIGEMYGMTENTAFSHSSYRKIKIGTVGQPWPECEVRLGADNEIEIRHQALMMGYYKDEAATREIFTEDGFLKTGDKGTIDKENFLRITGRVKDQFKTDKGKYISPAPIELKLLVNTDIEQACVVGTGLPQPVALITLSQNGLPKPKPDLEKGLIETLNSINPSLETYEQLEKIIIMKDPWTLDNGMLTPSLKLKRNLLEKINVPKYKKWYHQDGLVIWE